MCRDLFKVVLKTSLLATRVKWEAAIGHVEKPEFQPGLSSGDIEPVEVILPSKRESQMGLTLHQWIEGSTPKLRIPLETQPIQPPPPRTGLRTERKEAEQDDTEL